MPIYVVDYFFNSTSDVVSIFMNMREHTTM